jgi:hypothetical protein
MKAATMLDLLAGVPCECPHCGAVAVIPRDSFKPSVIYWCEVCGVALLSFEDSTTMLARTIAGDGPSDGVGPLPNYAEEDGAVRCLRYLREEWFHEKGWYG